MTSLPQLPPNLQSTVPKIPNVTPQIPQFPAELKNLENIGAQADAVTQKLIDAAIPENIVDDLIQRYKLPDGSVDFEQVAVKLNEIADNFANGLTSPPPPTLTSPSAAILKLLDALIPELPVINIPTPAQIQNRVKTLLEKRAAARQKVITKAQLQAAKLERESPFTARSNLINNSQRLSQINSIATRPDNQ